MTAAFPAFLLAGALLSTLPIVLHLLARRPPERAPLPTARFLRPDPRVLLRLRRRPTDRPLMLVRVALVFSLSAAFAGLGWVGPRAEDVHVVLVDAGSDSLVDWPGAIAAVRAAVASTREDRTAVVVAYGLDEGYRVVAPDQLDRLVRGERPATAEDGLRSLSEAASASAWRNVQVSWVARPSWHLWTRGIGLMRPALWPGRTTLVPAPARSAGSGADAPVSAGIVGPSQEGPLRRAIEALGVETVPGPEWTGSDPDWIFAPEATDLGPLLDRARNGATLVLSGPLPTGRAELPWSSGDEPGRPGTSDGGSGPAPRAPDPVRLLLRSGHTLEGVTTRRDGRPAAGAAVVAVFDDAMPAAASRPLGRGCIVYLAADLLDSELTRSGTFPLLVEALASGCAEVESSGPLDRGAVSALERRDLPVTVEGTAIATAGTPLSAWLVALCLLLFLAELGLTRRRDV